NIDVNLRRLDQLLNLDVLVRLMSHALRSRSADDDRHIETWTEVCAIGTVRHTANLRPPTANRLDRCHRGLNQAVVHIRLQRLHILIHLDFDPKVRLDHPCYLQRELLTAPST